MQGGVRINDRRKQPRIVPHIGGPVESQHSRHGHRPHEQKESKDIPPACIVGKHGGKGKKDSYPFIRRMHMPIFRKGPGPVCQVEDRRSVQRDRAPVGGSHRIYRHVVRQFQFRIDIRERREYPALVPLDKDTADEFHLSLLIGAYQIPLRPHVQIDRSIPHAGKKRHEKGLHTAQTIIAHAETIPVYNLVVSQRKMVYPRMQGVPDIFIDDHVIGDFPYIGPLRSRHVEYLFRITIHPFLQTLQPFLYRRGRLGNIGRLPHFHPCKAEKHDRDGKKKPGDVFTRPMQNTPKPCSHTNCYL